MSARNEQKLPERNIPGMNRHERFGEVQHAEHAGTALKRMLTYFAQEKAMVICMLMVVIFGTLCGVYAPSLQSSAIDIIAGTRAGKLWQTLLLMLLVYLLYSGGQFIQNLLSAKLSQCMVRQMREELLGQLNGTVEEMISVGVISAFIVYARQFSRPINEIAQIYGQLQTAVAGAERVFAVLDEEEEEKSGKELAEEEKAEVVFQNVNFSYAAGHPVIRNFTLAVPSGKKVALVGATGSGKTTIVNLLMRFYDTDSGEIFINNQNIRDISREHLRKKIAIVLQDTVLFSDTVRNNLKYGNENATDAQIQRAMEMSRCGDMLEKLPQGYDTVLTGAGETISQGQRQLLAIARAFVADPKILILDEATASVNTRTEKAIQDAMQRVMQNRTSIVIAHRLSTIRDSDLIVVMDHGEIVESGSHEELLCRKGKYYELYMTQYAGFAI